MISVDSFTKARTTSKMASRSMLIMSRPMDFFLNTTFMILSSGMATKVRCTSTSLSSLMMSTNKISLTLATLDSKLLTMSQNSKDTVLEFTLTSETLQCGSHMVSKHQTPQVYSLRTLSPDSSILITTLVESATLLMTREMQLDLVTKIPMYATIIPKPRIHSHRQTFQPSCSTTDDIPNEIS